MPYKTRKAQGNKGESEFALAVKLCWFIYKFENPNNQIPLKKFCDDFEEFVVNGHILEILSDDYGIEWTFYNKDGSMCSPNYNTARKSWRPNYLWKEEYPKFKSDRLMSTEATEREKYIRYMAKLNKNDFDLLDRCYDKEKEYTAIEESGGKDMTYYRNKNNDTISNIDDRLRKRNGFDKTKVEVDGNLNASVEAKVSTNLLEKMKQKRSELDDLGSD